MNISVIFLTYGLIYIIGEIETNVNDPETIFELQLLRAGIYFFALIALIFLMVLRLHDFGKSGLWACSFFVIYMLQGYFDVIGNDFANYLTGGLLLFLFLLISLSPRPSGENEISDKKQNNNIR
jgi:uncharacterized membrane protein YhaH (DUF805 family)